MALTIVLLIGGFVWLFATINPYLSDFLGAQAAPSPTQTTAVARAAVPITPTAAPAQPSATAAPTEAPSASPSQQVTATAASDAFAPDYVVGSNRLNFRSAAGTSGSEILTGLDPGTQLQSTGKKQTVDGVVWLEFNTEQGQTGWVREIDVNPR